MYHDNSAVDALMRRGYIYLEDQDWKNAKDYFDDSLDLDPENSQAYIGMLLAELHIMHEDEITKSEVSFTDNDCYQKAIKFAQGSYRQTVEKYNLENVLYRAERLIARAKTEDEYLEAAKLFESISGYKNASERAEIAHIRAKDAKIKFSYQSAAQLSSSSSSEDVKKAKQIYETISGYKDSSAKIEECTVRIAELEKSERRVHRAKKVGIVLIISAALAIAFFILLSKVNSAKRTEDEIYNNFLGKSFSGKLEDDDGAYYDYQHDQVSHYRTYWLTTDEYTLTFHTDGTVSEKRTEDRVVLIYHSNLGEPENTHDERDREYDSFSVHVTLSGKAYLDIGYQRYQIFSNADNEPITINDYGYDEISLDVFS